MSKLQRFEQIYFIMMSTLFILFIKQDDNEMTQADDYDVLVNELKFETKAKVTTYTFYLLMVPQSHVGRLFICRFHQGIASIKADQVFTCFSFFS